MKCKKVLIIRSTSLERHEEKNKTKKKELGSPQTVSLLQGLCHSTIDTQCHWGISLPTWTQESCPQASHFPQSGGKVIPSWESSLRLQSGNSSKGPWPAIEKWGSLEKVHGQIIGNKIYSFQGRSSWATFIVPYKDPGSIVQPPPSSHIGFVLYHHCSAVVYDHRSICLTHPFICDNVVASLLERVEANPL